MNQSWFVHSAKRLEIVEYSTSGMKQELFDVPNELTATANTLECYGNCLAVCSDIVAVGTQPFRGLELLPNGLDAHGVSRGIGADVLQNKAHTAVARGIRTDCVGHNGAPVVVLLCNVAYGKGKQKQRPEGPRLLFSMTGLVISLKKIPQAGDFFELLIL